MSGAQKNGSDVLGPDARLRRLTKALETPFYLYDETKLTANARAIFAAFSWNEGFGQFVPMKYCGKSALLAVLRAEGCGVLCTNLAQLQLAAQCGYSGGEVIFSPLVPHPPADALAMELDATWLVDGVYVLPPRAPRRVLLRYNPGEKLLAAGKTLANFNRIKYGMTEEELFDMARRFAAFGSESVGLTMEAKENCLEGAYYPAVARELFQLAVRLRERTGIAADVFHLAGGIGISDRQQYPSPDLNAAAHEIRLLAEEILVPAGLKRMRLQTALGRYLLADAAALITSVIHVRQRDMPSLFLDAAFTPSAFTGIHRRVESLDPPGKRPPALYCLVGSEQSLHCTFDERCVLPAQKPGCRLLVRLVGADVPGDAELYLLRADGTLEKL